MRRTKRSVTQVVRSACLMVTAILTVFPVEAAQRLTDKEVRELLERIDHERDRFEDQLDGKIKRSILRGPGGEVNVERYLDDLQDNVERMKERFSDQYAASAEVTAVLRQGADIQRFMAAQPANLDGASEWNRLASSLTELAAVYAVSMPLPEGQQARRMNDREVVKTADGLADNADRFKRALDESLRRDKSVDRAAREAVVKEADALKKDLETLADVVGDGRPASGEAQAVIQRAARLRTATTAHSLSPAARTAWESVMNGLDKVSQAFHLPTVAR